MFIRGQKMHCKKKSMQCTPNMVCYVYWASEASPTLGCSIEISRDIYIYVVGMSYVCRMSN